MRCSKWTLVLLIAGFCPLSACSRDGGFFGTNAGEERTIGSRKMQFCWCPPGKFTMGSPKDEAGRLDHEDQVDVTLSRGFWMGKYEVTQAQCTSVMGKNPSHFKGDSLPVEQVNWNEAMEFCEKLTKMERNAGRLPQGWEYRLPTEAQWEYACQAGTTTAYSFGHDPKQLGDYAWYFDNSDETTHAVGEKKPNAWGLCDMHGNVWEWCRDGYQSKVPGGTDPEVTLGSRRVHRGGSGGSTAEPCRSSFRRSRQPIIDVSDLGFRLAAVPTSQHAKDQ